MPLAETAKLVAELSLNDKLSGGVGKALRSVGRLEGGLGRAGKGVGQLAGGLARVGAVAGGVAVAGIAAAAKAGADFESQLNTINTVVRGTPEQLKQIGDQVRTIARDTGTPLEELTAGYYDLVSAGIAAKDASNVLTAANQLAIGGLASTAETVDLLTTAINVYGGDASKATAYADAFAKAIERGKVTAPEIAASFASVGPLANTMGIELNEIAAAYAQLTAQGVPATEVATQMSSALIALVRRTGDLEKLEKQTKKSYAAIAAKEGLVPALEQLRKDAEKAKVPLIDLLGRKEGLLFALATTGDNLSTYAQNLDAVGDSAGTAAGQMSERQQGLSFQVAKLKANLIDAGLSLSEGFLPALSRSVGKLTEFLNTTKNRDQLKAIGEDIGEAIDGIEWDKVLDGARTFVDVLKQALEFGRQIFDVINTLPTEIKAAGLGFIGLNKLSGGLIGEGVGNIIGGLGSTLIRNIGANLPGVGKAFVQPVFVVNMPPGGIGGGGVTAAAKGGAVGTLAKGAAALGLTAVAAGAVALVHDDLTQRNARLAESIEDQAKRFTRENVLSRRQLESTLDGVRGQIANLESLPFFAPGRDESIASLRNIEAGLVAELENTRNAIRTSSAEQTAAIAGFRQQEANAGHTNTQRLEAVLGRFQDQERSTENTTRDRLDNLARLEGESSEGVRAAAAKARQDAADQKAKLDGVRAETQETRYAAVAAASRTTTAARNAGTISAAATFAAANRIVGAIFAARPVIQSTTVVNQTINQSRHSTNASRHR